MGRFSTGQAIRRREDQRLITGEGRYTDDIEFPGQAWIYFFRSPFPHGRIIELDLAAAREADGVLAVYSGADLAAAGVGDLPGAGLPAGPAAKGRRPLQQPPLARERVRYVGEPVAAVVAESLARAKDAAELIVFDVEEIGAVVTPGDALAEGAALVHDAIGGNLYGTLAHGDREAADAAFDRAAQVVAISIVNNRLAPTALEPRACNLRPDPEADGALILYQGCQGVHALRARLAETLGMSDSDLRVVCPDVGGAFGLKFFLQCETVVAAHACRSLGRPVKWTADRSESFLSDVHGRDHESMAELAIDADGRFLGLRATINANLGAYCSQAGPLIPWFGASMAPGVYRIPAVHVDVNVVLTNTVPVDAYRGAGRPEATYLLERLVDKAARRLGMDPAELRRRNFIETGQFPYTTATGRVYDSGDYAALLEAALDRADWRGFPERRAQSERRGRLRGIGLACYVEICSVAGGEEARIRLETDGRVSVRVGTQTTGQGHETSYVQLVAGLLEIDPATIDVLQGDTAVVPDGEGTAGSRTMAIGGTSVYRGTERLIDAGRRMAAEMLEAAVADVEYAAGRYQVAGTDRAVTLQESAAASYDDERRPEGVEPGLASSERFVPEDGTFPNGCHICEVEIDPETGAVDILRYTIEDDVGNVINPLILEGQIVGGVGQGLGQAAVEHAVYDRDSGQLVTATFMDYAMPRADDLPNIDFRYREVPSPRNVLGVKGAGEAGTVGSAPAFVNAVVDALAARGIEHVDMPLTPGKVWGLLRDAGRGAGRA